jgi:putative membrane protein
MKSGNGQNTTSLIKLLFFSLFTILLIRILINGDLVKYVHPRFAPFIAVSCAISLCMIVAIFRYRLSAGDGRISVIRIIALSLPLVLGFTVRPVTGSFTDDFSSGGSLSKIGLTDNRSSTRLPEPIIDARKSEIVNIAANHYFMIIQDIYDNPAAYRGRRVQIMGKTMTRKKSPDKSEFAVVRMMMTCCTADLQPIGLICKYPHLSDLNKSQWYNFSGIINYIEKNNESIPVITVDSAEITQKPENEYVYPF